MIIKDTCCFEMSSQKPKTYYSSGPKHTLKLLCSGGIEYPKTTVYGVVCFGENSSPRENATKIFTFHTIHRIHLHD